MSFHNKKFPNETPDYREARNKILALEIEMRAQNEKIAEMKKSLPLGGKIKEDYEFSQLGADSRPSTLRFSSLFEGGKNSLLVYSFMYGPNMDQACPACTSFLDSLNANAVHLLDRINIAVVAKSPIERVEEFARSRGWNHMKLLSSESNSYNKDYFAENDEGRQIPALNVFQKTDEGIFHHYNTELLYADLKGHPRHVDCAWPIWNLLEMTPEGRGENWFPKLNYDS